MYFDFEVEISSPSKNFVREKKIFESSIYDMTFTLSNKFVVRIIMALDKYIYCPLLYLNSLIYIFVTAVHYNFACTFVKKETFFS